MVDYLLIMLGNVRFLNMGLLLQLGSTIHPGSHEVPGLRPENQLMWVGWGVVHA